MQRAEGQGQVGTRAAESEEGGSISDQGRGGRWGRRGGRGGGRRGGTVPEQPPPLGLPLQVEIVLLLPLLPGPLVVILLLQVPHGRPAVLLKILLVFWSRRGGARLEGRQSGERSPGTPTPTLMPRGPVSQEHIPGPGLQAEAPAFTEAPPLAAELPREGPMGRSQGVRHVSWEQNGGEERGREQVWHLLR